jgi:nitrate reductase NapAB chaperone NapD
VFIWNAGSAALDTASNLGLKYTDGSGAIITVVEAASTYSTADLVRVPAMTITAITGVANAAIVFSDSSANPGTGTGGRLRIICFYSTIRTDL